MKHFYRLYLVFEPPVPATSARLEGIDERTGIFWDVSAGLSSLMGVLETEVLAGVKGKIEDSRERGLRRG